MIGIRGRYGPQLFLLLFAGLSVAALGALATPVGHSYILNISWFVAFEEALAAGSLYPRHLPALWEGAGGLDLYFYGPLPFYLAAGPARLVCPGCAPQTVFALAGGLLIGLSAVAFYPLARRFLAAGPALAGAVAYALMPYHLGVDWFLRQAVGEVAAYVFVPLVALGLVSVLRDGRAGLAFPLGLAGLILSHLPSALLAGHVFGAVFLVWALANRGRALTALLRLGAMAAIGLALAGLYWLPAVVLLGDVSAATLFEAHMTATNWLFLDGTDAPDPAVAAVVGLCLAVALLVALLALLSLPRAERGAYWLWIGVPVGLSAVLMTGLAHPVWAHWIIDRVQFPWRLMVFVDLAAGLAAGVLASTLRGAGGRSARLAAAVGLIALPLGLAATTPFSIARIQAGLERPGEPMVLAGAAEYLPPAFFQPIAAAVIADGRQSWQGLNDIRAALDAARWTADGYTALSIAPGSWSVVPAISGPVILPVPYWRHMEARTEVGETVDLAPTPDLGLVTFTAPPDAQRIEIRLPPHWSERAGAGLSLLGLAGLAWLAWRRRAEGQPPPP